MSGRALYDEDILLWSEQQAAVIRRLGNTDRQRPNDLDVENVAEEIESVGRSEMAAVESYLRLLMLHLIKLVSVPNSPASRHWRDEARNFGVEALTRFTPSMAQRVDLERAWRLASRQVKTSFAEHGDAVAPLPDRCPWTVEELIREELDMDLLLSALERTAAAPPVSEPD